MCQNWLKPPSSKSHCHGCMLDFHPDSWFSNHSLDGEDEMGGIPTKGLLIDNVHLSCLILSITKDYFTFFFTFPSQLVRSSLIFISIWQTTKAKCLASPSRLGGNGCKRESNRPIDIKASIQSLVVPQRHRFTER